MSHGAKDTIESYLYLIFNIILGAFIFFAIISVMPTDVAFVLGFTTIVFVVLMYWLIQRWGISVI